MPAPAWALFWLGAEKLVKYACIMHGLFDAAGWPGLGAVMGLEKPQGRRRPRFQPLVIKSPERVKEYLEGPSARLKK